MYCCGTRKSHPRTRIILDMSDGMKIKRAKHVSSSDFYIYFNVCRLIFRNQAMLFPIVIILLSGEPIAEVENRVVSLKINFSWTRVC